MSELQAGMLALIVGFSRNPHNVGKIVTVENKVVMGTPSYDGNGIFADPCGWLVTGEDLNLTKGLEIIKSNYCYVDESHLMPIKPEADPLDATHKEELHA